MCVIKGDGGFSANDSYACRRFAFMHVCLTGELCVYVCVLLLTVQGFS